MPGNKEIIDIIKEYLKENGFDGFFINYEHGQCNCSIDTLFACGNPDRSCKAGYYQHIKDCLECGDDECYCIGYKKECVICKEMFEPEAPKQETCCEDCLKDTLSMKHPYGFVGVS